MENNLYRIELFAHHNMPQIDCVGMLYTNDGMAFVKLHPVRIKATQKTKKEAELYWKPITPGIWHLACSACDSHLKCREDAKFCHECGAMFVKNTALAQEHPSGGNMDTMEAKHVRTYTAHEVAEILAEAFGDACACNFNGIDEWLPEKCELQSSCPNPVGVACWEQFLKFRETKIN